MRKIDFADGTAFIAETGMVPNMTSLKLVMGALRAPSQTLDFLEGGHFDFNSSLEQQGYDIDVRDQQHFYLNASWGAPRNVTVESGGVITSDPGKNPTGDSFNLSSTG
jgi:hypothetical protein